MLSGPVDFDDFRSGVLAMVNDMGPMLPPDGDWDPTIIMDCGEDKRAVIAALATDNKDILAYVMIPAMIKMFKPRWAAIILPAWQWLGKPQGVPQPGETKMEWADRERKNLEKTEIVAVEVSDGTRDELWHAQVLRSDKHPTLAKWDDMTTPVSEGRMAGVLLRSFHVGKRHEG